MISSGYIETEWHHEGRPEKEKRLLSEGLTLQSARDRYDIACIVASNAGVRPVRKRYAVYAIVCQNHLETPYKTKTELGKASRAPIIYYVGFSSDVVERLHQHCHGHAVSLTNRFEPLRLVGIEWFEYESDAREREYELADELRDEHPRAYVGGGR